MKDKRLTYILLPIVAAIWGFTIYKYFFESQEELVPTETTISLTAASDHKVAIVRDSFKLLGDYRDPFLSRIYESKDRRKETAATPVMHQPVPTKKVETKPSPKTNWSIYKYNGLIQKSGSASTQLGILRIRNKSHFVQTGENIEDLEVLSLSGDSIRLRIGAEEQTIKRY